MSQETPSSIFNINRLIDIDCYRLLSTVIDLIEFFTRHVFIMLCPDQLFETRTSPPPPPPPPHLNFTLAGGEFDGQVDRNVLGVGHLTTTPEEWGIGQIEVFDAIFSSRQGVSGAVTKPHTNLSWPSTMSAAKKSIGPGGKLHKMEVVNSPSTD